MASEIRKVVIAGAGVSGLALANRLLELAKQAGRTLEVVLLESSERAGGAVATETRDGFLLEKGPDSILSGNPRMSALCERLGLSGRLVGTRSEHRKTLVVHDGKLVPLPEGFYLIAPRNIGAFLTTPLFSLRGKMRMLAESVVPRAKSGEDESVSSFIRRRFGEEALERVGQPMIAGVYSGDPEELSILSTMPRFRRAEAEYGSVIRGLRKEAKQADREARGPRYSLFSSFDGGMKLFTEALKDRLPAAVLRTCFVVASISHDAAAKKWNVVSQKGESVTADALCLAVPASASSAWIDPFDPKLSELLDEIAYESVATLNLAFDADAIGNRLEAFGFVAPQSESRSLMGCTFVHRKFDGRAPEGKVLLRAFVGGAFGRRLFYNSSDKELEQVVLEDLNALLGIRKKPLFSVLTRYAHALPQYRVGHAQLLQRIDEALSKHPHLVLTGSSYRGTGIPDCIADAEVSAEKLFKLL